LEIFSNFIHCLNIPYSSYSSRILFQDIISPFSFIDKANSSFYTTNKNTKGCNSVFSSLQTADKWKIRKMQLSNSVPQPAKFKSKFLLTCSVINILLFPLCVGLEVRVILSIIGLTQFKKKMQFNFYWLQGSKSIYSPRRMGIDDIYFGRITRLRHFMRVELLGKATVW
jgi:hypothetical protein